MNPMIQSSQNAMNTIEGSKSGKTAVESTEVVKEKNAPVASNDNLNNMALNRRVEFVKLQG